MPHLSEHINGIRIERQIGLGNDPQGVQLMPKYFLPEHKLRRVRAIKTVHAVGTHDPVLEEYGRTVGDLTTRLDSCAEDKAGSIRETQAIFLSSETYSTFARRECAYGSGPEWKKPVMFKHSSAISSSTPMTSCFFLGKANVSDNSDSTAWVNE